MMFYSLILIVVCCVAWSTRPGRRPQLLTLDILPWLCVAGFVAVDGALGMVLAWMAVPLIYFSIKYNQLDSSAISDQHVGTSTMCQT